MSNDTVRTVEPDVFVARLRERVDQPDYIKRTAEADRLGQLSIENVRTLQELGVTGMVVDPAHGETGPGLDLIVRVTETLGYRDPSTAVALNMHWGGARSLGQMPSFPRRDEAFAAIRAHEAVTCGAFSVPSGSLDARTARLHCRADGDDLVFSGRAGFGSMSDAAAYVMVGGVIDGSAEDGQELFAMTIARSGEPGLINHRNWSAMGMRATGSNDIECAGLRVPRADCLVTPLDSLKAQRKVTDSAIVAFGVAGIWLGAARAAFDFTLDHVQHRYGYMAEGTFNPAAQTFHADEAWAHTAIGNMDHWLGTGRALLYDMISRIDSYDDEHELTRDLVRTLFHLRRMTEEVAMGAMKTCGAHGFVTDRPLERIFRDLLGGVVMAWKTDQLQQTLGVGALGRPIRFTGPGGN
ncbi:acyl-CoA dehydrogenase family protein [Amycolatopsis sp. GM8]|uniref:acyl-CoA dehydrogenase family protein n=1 Tax=Amycolatopsis sp. GM8 TaxID=2896530 RepID=UPI001F2B3431|nr:acyl-CoA dehydrogenase family protein [Amycolatopsis sp. GM8]